MRAREDPDGCYERLPNGQLAHRCPAGNARILEISPIDHAPVDDRDAASVLADTLPYDDGACHRHAYAAIVYGHTFPLPTPGNPVSSERVRAWWQQHQRNAVAQADQFASYVERVLTDDVPPTTPQPAAAAEATPPRSLLRRFLAAIEPRPLPAPKPGYEWVRVGSRTMQIPVTPEARALAARERELARANRPPRPPLKTVLQTAWQRFIASLEPRPLPTPKPGYEWVRVGGRSIQMRVQPPRG